MKLKELHLRNIASIEQADIDFEKGLNDLATGTPAPIFLISGDTGAGKSVILDGISMALYRKTPRTAGVANSIKNDFTDNEGQSIRVASIEQYTRLGISEKDDSYSEVVFEGNDDKIYHARLTLGYTLSAKDKVTGERHRKYRTPKWELRIDDGDWTKDSVEQTIHDAVGLDFQQFGRMAMLAQGQFAQFLTGEKKEREAILEQLTNTQHFTEYGEAINSLWKKAKENRDNIQSQYDTEKTHILTDEEVNETSDELQYCTKQLVIINQELQQADRTLRLIETIQRSEKSQQEARQSKAELERIISGEEYKRNKLLFTNWDRTTTQRQWVAELFKARQEEFQAKASILRAKETFRFLTADIADRQIKRNAFEKSINELKEWIGKHADNNELFSKAGEVDLKLKQFTDNMKKATELLTILKQERDKTEVLEKEKNDAIVNSRKAEEVVKQRQELIDSLNKKRSDMNPQTLNEELSKQNTRRQNLTHLQSQVNAITSITDENDKLENILKEEYEELKTIHEACLTAEAAYASRKLEKDFAAKRLTTMKMSLDDKIRELRHRLYDEHTETCPLCGQHIEHICLDDEFKNILSPIEEELQQAQERLSMAEKQRDELKSKFNILNGTYRNNLKRKEENTKKILQMQSSTNELARTLGIDIKKDLSETIAHNIECLTSSILSLEKAQQETERLQNEINRLIKEKQPFDNNKAKAAERLLLAETAVKNNAEAILRAEKECGNINKECEKNKTEIDSHLANYCKNWLSDPETLRKKLKEDTKIYTDKQNQLKDCLTEQAKADTLINTLTQYCEDIMRKCPDWTIEISPIPCTCNDINKEWTDFLSMVSTLILKINENREIIRRLETSLADFYKVSGMTEQSLKSLIDTEPLILEARRMVANTDARLKSRIDAITDAQELITKALKELNVNKQEELQDYQILVQKKIQDSNRHDELLTRQAQATSRLEQHQKNHARLKEIQTKLSVAIQNFERWDKLNSLFGGTRFRTLVQTYIMRPLLNNANIYLEQITDRYHLTCSEDNEQLAILVLDRYNKNQVRSVTVLSGGERFMVSLALSLALSSLNRPDLNVNILFIDEGFGTLDEKSLDSVMATLERLQDIAGQSNRRVGIISHREELEERIPVKIQVIKKGEGRSIIN